MEGFDNNWSKTGELQVSDESSQSGIDNLISPSPLSAFDRKTTSPLNASSKEFGSKPDAMTVDSSNSRVKWHDQLYVRGHRDRSVQLHQICRLKDNHPTCRCVMVRRVTAPS